MVNNKLVSLKNQTLQENHLPKVLIVDDREENLLAMKKILKKLDIEILQALSGNDALSLMLHYEFCLVLLDVQMPEMDGFEVAKLMRENEKTMPIPIIFVTAISKEEKYVFKGYESGAVDYLFKPLDPHVLRHKVQVFIELFKKNQILKEQSVILKKQNEELKVLDHLKDELINTVAHELRTPLAISKETTSLVLDEISGPINEKQKKYLQSSKNNLIRLNTIVNDFLDLSTVEAGKIILNKSFVDMGVLLNEFCETYQSVINTKSQTLKVSIPKEPIFAFIDCDKIIQIVTNLLNNAHKFTPEKGIIKLILEVSEQKIICSIEDTGMGISEGNLPELFKKFKQFKREHGPGIKGTGLGLSIAKSLVELHDGEIWVKSISGEGSTFSFSLPTYTTVKKNFDQYVDDILNQKEFDHNPVSFVTLYLGGFSRINKKYGEKILQEVSNSLLECCSETITRPKDKFILYDVHTIHIVLPGTDRAGAGSVIYRIKQMVHKKKLTIENMSELELKFGISIFPDQAHDREGLIKTAFVEGCKKKRILVVDDHPQIVRILQARLENKNVSFESAANGLEALEKIEASRPDLIILDIMMPKMNGYEVIGRLKENSETASIPIIILTATMLNTVKKECSRLGNTPVIQKTGGFMNLIDLAKEIL